VRNVGVSYLLFMDESGHDHRQMPYEARGGVAFHARRLWPFIQAMRSAEEGAFGALLGRYGSEIKGHKLLDRDRFAWAAQGVWMDDVERRKHSVSFLSKGAARESPNRTEFTAYGQACLTMVRSLFRLLRDHEAVLFASAIPKGSVEPRTSEPSGLLRKDHVYLLERYFYFLEEKQEEGLLVMDETEKETDTRFVRDLQRYFTRTEPGRYRTAWIVPAPFFVSSDMTYPIQAADVCIYCVNLGFRLPTRGMDAPVREEIAQEFGPWLAQLQFRGQGYRDGSVYESYGIVYIEDPFTDRRA